MVLDDFLLFGGLLDGLLRSPAEQFLRVRQGGEDKLIGLVGVTRIAPHHFLQTLDVHHRLNHSGGEVVRWWKALPHHPTTTPPHYPLFSQSRQDLLRGDRQTAAV